MSLRDDLIAAKALIDTPEKWGKGFASFGFGGPLCVAGACKELAFRTGDGDFLYTRLYRVLEEALPPEWGKNVRQRTLPVFNDEQATTHADVMALFDRAIEAAP